MGWLDLVKPWTYPEHFVGGLKKLRDTPMRTGDSEFRDPNRENFNVPGYEDRQNRIMGYEGSLMGRKAPQAADSDFRQGQSNLANMLMAQAQGANSISREQLRQDADRNISQQQAFAASASPGQGAMMARMASQNAGRIGQGLAGQTAMAGIAERNAAASALGGVLNGARGQDLNNNQFNAGMQQNQMGMNQAGLLGLLGQESANAGMQQAGGMGYEGARTSRYNASLGVPSGLEGYISGLSSVGGAAATSDIRAKTNIHDGSAKADALMAWERRKQSDQLSRRQDTSALADALSRRDENDPHLAGIAAGKWDRGGFGIGHDGRQRDTTRVTMDGGRSVSRQPGFGPAEVDKFTGSITPYRYEYKDQARHGTGERLGVMAQDLEKSPIGASAVFEQGGTKSIDLQKLGPGLLAGLSRLDERLRKVEKK